MKRIGTLVLIIVLAGGLVAEYFYLTRRNSNNEKVVPVPPTEQTGTFISSSGEFKLYMHADPVKETVESGYILREGNRLETKQGASAVFDGCLDAPQYTIPVRFNLRENTCIGLMKSPAIDIEKGSLIVRVPADSMGFRVNLKEPKYSMSAQAIASDADMLVSREGDRLSIICYRGQVRLWSVGGEITLSANQKASITPDEKPTEAESITAAEMPEESREDSPK